MSVSYFTNSKGIKLAYVHTKACGEGVDLPAVVFLGGFKSDMSGTKALFLEERCRKAGQEYLRLDYTGHGQSEGEFVDGTIGEWLEDSREIMSHVVESSEVIVVGSSMGGWLALRLLIDSQVGAAQIRGVVGIAAAPDFTKDIEAQLTPEQCVILEKTGRIEEDNEYDDEPYIFTQSLLDDGRTQSLLDSSEAYKISAKLTLLQGKEDISVPWEKASRIKQVFDGPQTEIIFIDDGDHSLSRPEDLALLDVQITLMS